MTHIKSFSLSLLVFTLASCQCLHKHVWHIRETFFILKLAKIIQSILTSFRTCSSSQALKLCQVNVFELPDFYHFLKLAMECHEYSSVRISLLKLVNFVQLNPNFITTVEQNIHAPYVFPIEFLRTYYIIHTFTRYKVCIQLVEIKCQLDATDDFYCRSYCLLNMLSKQ